VTTRRAGLATAAAAVAAVGFAAWAAAPADHTGQGGGSSVHVGVRDGDSIRDYLAGTRAETVQLGQSSVALVSLARYHRPAEVVALTGGVDLLTSLARVPLPRRQTELVRLDGATTGSLSAAMSRLAERKFQDFQRYRRDGAPDFAAVAEAEAEAYRDGCACVYALVVRGGAADLRALAGRPGVRGVDPAPEVADLSRAVFVAPLPEQDTIVVPPADGP
jgi:hypothetical protein